MKIIKSNYQGVVETWEVNYRKDYRLISNRFYDKKEADRFYCRLLSHKFNNKTYYGEFISEIYLIHKPINL